MHNLLYMNSFYFNQQLGDELNLIVFEQKLSERPRSASGYVTRPPTVFTPSANAHIHI